MAQTLKFGNGTWATKKGSTLAYSDTNENYKPLPFNYTGAGKGTRVNKEGLIEVVENDRPRIDYTDSEDGVFLLEKAATNLITYSEDFSQWAIQSATINSNETISPDGTNNADKFTRTASNNNLRFITSISGNYTFSIFLKADTKNWVLLYINYSGGTDGQTYVDLENGIIGNEVGTDNKIEDFGNGWFKVSVTFNTPATLSDVRLVIADDNGVISGSDGSIFVWGAQLESGNLSSYIPTQGTIQTRVQETASGSGNSEVFNDSEGVLFANIAANANDGTSRFLGVSDGSLSNRVNIIYNASNQLIAQIQGAGSLTANGVNILLFNKSALKYKSGDNQLWVSGFKVDSNTSTSGSTVGLDVLDLAAGNGNFDFYGKTKEIGYYDTALTDLELETLTSYRTWEEMVKELNLNIIHNE
jgi:hypothetical protein